MFITDTFGNCFTFQQCFLIQISLTNQGFHCVSLRDLWLPYQTSLDGLKLKINLGYFKDCCFIAFFSWTLEMKTLIPSFSIAALVNESLCFCLSHCGGAQSLCHHSLSHRAETQSRETSWLLYQSLRGSTLSVPAPPEGLDPPDWLDCDP